MNSRILAALAALATVAAAPAADKRPVVERSPDVLRLRPLDGAAKELAARAPADPAAAAAPTQAEVGDADSFGRNVTYLGLAQTQAILLRDDCSGTDPAVERCIVNQPAPALTSFHESGLASMQLPAKATKSLLCFTLTPFINVSWANHTGLRQTARFNAWADIIIESPVLTDPSLIDETTGQPFNGALTVRLSTWHNTHSIDDGEFEQERSSQSRGCIGGLLSQRSLVEDYGLTPTQASQVFRRPLSLSFGAQGSVAMSDSTLYFYGIRVYGD